MIKLLCNLHKKFWIRFQSFYFLFLCFEFTSWLPILKKIKIIKILFKCYCCYVTSSVTNVALFSWFIFFNLDASPNINYIIILNWSLHSYVKCWIWSLALTSFQRLILFILIISVYGNVLNSSRNLFFFFLNNLRFFHLEHIAIF